MEIEHGIRHLQDFSCECQMLSNEPAHPMRWWEDHISLIM